MPAETLHSTPQGSSPEERRLAKAQAEFEKAAFDLNQKSAFGLLDHAVPNEGEDTYQSYLDKRPTDGTYRNGDNFHDAQTGSFSSEQAYESQKGDTQAYYDQLGSIENQSEYQAPNYEDMGVMQLAKEAAKAQRLGDRAEEATIREALEQHLTIDALKDDVETPEAAQKRYEAEIVRYEELVGKFAGGSDAVSSAESAPKTSAEQKPESAEETPTETSSDSVEQESQSAEKESADPDIFLNGEKVTISNVFESPDGQKAVLVNNPDGSTRFVHEKELTYGATEEDTVQASEQAQSVEEAELEADTTAEAEADSATPNLSTSKEVERFVGKELEPYDASRHELEKHEVEKEQAKKWWEKARDGVRKRAGVAYWAAQWETYVASPAREGWSKVLEYGVTDDMTDAEKEKRRKNNRVAVIIAGAGIVALGAGVIIESGLNAALNSNPDLNDAAGELGKAASGAGAAAGLKELVPDVGDGSHSALFTPEAALPPMTIESGDGGEALFTRYGIPIEKWYDNAQTLLNQFPQDFYSEGNDVRIAHTGSLSQGAQDFINTLR